MTRLAPETVACWLLRSRLLPEDISPGWSPGTALRTTRCLRRSYRLGLMRPGQPCVLWVSGRDDPGVHAVGELTGPVEEGPSGPQVPVALTRLAAPVPRGQLLADPATRDAEVLRMPAGSNPSWLAAGQYAAVLARIADAAG